LSFRHADFLSPLFQISAFRRHFFFRLSTRRFQMPLSAFFFFHFHFSLRFSPIFSFFS